MIAALAEALLGLILQTDEIVADLPLADLLRSRRAYRLRVAPKVNEWLLARQTALRAAIGASADRSAERVESREGGVAWAWHEALQEGAGAALTVAPLTAVPFLATAATVATTSFLIVPTAAISLPVLSALIAGGVAVGVTGSSIRRRRVDRFRRRLRDHIRDDIRKRVLGDPVDPAAPSLAGVLCDEIDSIARARMGRLAA